MIHDSKPYWDVVMDMGYLGPARNTPGITRIIPKKNAKGSDRQIHIERFFGRLKRSFDATAQVYRLDNTHFDTDIDSCILQTNELLRYYELNEEDRAYYLGSTLLREKEHEKSKSNERSNSNGINNAKRHGK